MKLEELLDFEEIVIQCHDDPDADAVASGFALLEYLKSQGKAARLTYAGPRPISKSNLLLMIETLQIPLEYVQTLDHAPELLITADCQDGKTAPFAGDPQRLRRLFHCRVGYAAADGFPPSPAAVHRLVLRFVYGYQPVSGPFSPHG